MRTAILAHLTFLALFSLSCAQPAPTATVRLHDSTAAAALVNNSAAGNTAPSAPATPGDRRIRLSAAINEVLGFSFGIEPQTDLPSPVVRMTGFEGSGGTPALRMEAFRIHDVETPTLPGWHIRSIPPQRRLPRTPDVLVPVDAPQGGLGETIRANEPCRLWIDLHVDKGTPPGRYTGAIELAVQNKPVASVDVELTVWPFVLPDEASFPAIAEVDHRPLIRAAHGTGVSTDYWLDSPAAEEINQTVLHAARLLKDHGLTPVFPHLKPKVAPDPRGDVQADWTLFDTITGPMMDGSAFDDRLGLRVSYLAIADLLAANGSSSQTTAGESFLRKYVTRCVAHYKEKGWFDRAVAAIPIQGNEPPAAERTAHIAELLDSASASEIRIASPLFPQNMEPYGWMGFRPFAATDRIDIWYPLAQFLDPFKMDEEKDRGREVWLSADRPPYSGSISIHADEAAVRVLSWQTHAAQAAALHLGLVNNWPAADVASPQAAIEHDAATLFYPGRPFGLDAPIPSMRLKWLRRAMQDAAYARLLREHGLEHVAHALGTALVSYLGADAYRTHYADAKPTGWPADARTFDLAREIMGDELARVASGGDKERDVQRFSRTAAWQRLVRQTRSVRLEADGCRIRRMHTPAGGDAEINCTISAGNDRRTTLTGELRWMVDDLGIRPEGAKRIESAPPASTRKVMLAAKTTAAALSQNEENWFTFVLDAGEGQTIQLQERLAYLLAPPAKTTLRIDGELTDWPPSRINVADDFRLITPEAGNLSDPAESAASRSPAARTIAFLLRDDANLYVAVQCQSPGRSRTEVTQKRLEYDDLIPRGGDLVELLFDPLNLGSRSPADLYHIVLQRSGSDLAEKGVSLTPPVGSRQVWPVDLDVAIRRGADQWVAEVRIPLEAFGGAVPRGEFWGFNITRFDAENEEFSTWSGVVGNAYDPMGLGNLYLP